jgi:hypothetical protein
MKPSRHLSPERIADLLEKQVASNKQTLINVLLKYNETTIEPLVERIVELEKPWYRKLYRKLGGAK